MLIAQIIVWSLSTYATVGLLFALFFVWRGAARIDPSVQQSTWGFRLMIVPGGVAFWPLLLGRMLRGVQHPPTETNAHRQATQ